MEDSGSSILSAFAPYPLHLLGWKAFQDLCVGVAEECLRRPVQNFLPGNDAGRDGAFVGRWDGDDPAAGESTIQCKFTSRINANLTLSLLSDELDKARRLAAKGIANDYVIMTNHPVTGESELAIKSVFQNAGVGRCRIFGADWITRQIRTSPRLRMMAPRLYGLGDLHELLDSRAYQQAQMILSAMGDDLQRLVVTDAHRKSVRAISEHNLVLLLGAPAAGKSTIGASIAVGAADIWKSSTIRATSPEDVQSHLDPLGGQFIWIDDAWGNTQYQRQRTEAWNQVFPLMNGALRRGTRFLITSRDYIWRAASRDLKLTNLPVLQRSQVVINVQELTTPERAQILYNHIKMGDHPAEFKKAIKPFLPTLAERSDFLPETARRLASKFFSANLKADEESITKFFSKPKSFLLDTISSLSNECRSALAVVFLNGGKVRSPIDPAMLARGAETFGVSASATRDELEALNGSLLLLVQDAEGPYWTYKHPTVSDAYSSYLATSPELVELYLKGADPYSMLYEVVCGGVTIEGAPLTLPDSLHDIFAERLHHVPDSFIRTFLSYRANAKFAKLMLERRPTLYAGMKSFSRPIKEDPDATLLAALHRQGALSEEIRLEFVEAAAEAMRDEADASFLHGSLRDVFTRSELLRFESIAKQEVFPRVEEHVERLRSKWDPEYPPDDHFYELERSIETLWDFVTPFDVERSPLESVAIAIKAAVSRMEDEYEPPSSTSAPVSSSTPAVTGLQSLFRDVDE